MIRPRENRFPEATKTNKKKQDDAAFDQYYRSTQLTPEQKAELRAELKKDMERAAAAGVYRRLREAHEEAVRERAREAMLRDGLTYDRGFTRFVDAGLKLLEV